MTIPVSKAISAAALVFLAVAVSAQDYEQAVAKVQAGDHAGALADLIPLAEQGDARAQNLVGAIYANGQGGVARDNVAAAGWIRLAAEQEFTTAQFYLAGMYERGEGVAQNLPEAASWYGRAAGLGHAEAQFRLGSMYESGAGVEQDNSAAANWHRRSALQGHVAAQLRLGVMYYGGIGIPEDPVLAYVWIVVAAANGNESAAAVRSTIAAELSEPELALAEGIALRCSQQGYEFCDR